MKDIRRKAGAVGMALLFCFLGFSGCQKEKPLEISDDAALAVLQQLVPASYDINAVLFGDLLSAENTADEASHDTTYYVPVIPDDRFKTILDIKKAAENVYSMSYLGEVYPGAFEGISGEGDDNNSGLLPSLSARYKEIDGKLCINVSGKSLAIGERLSVLSTVVTEKTPKYVICSSVCSTASGGQIQKDFYLTCENSIWLLDGPTY